MCSCCKMSARMTARRKVAERFLQNCIRMNFTFAIIVPVFYLGEHMLMLLDFHKNFSCASNKISHTNGVPTRERTPRKYIEKRSEEEYPQIFLLC